MFGSTFIRFVAILVLTISAAPGIVVADNDPVGTTFTYQGRLTDAGDPAEGTVDLVFRLFDQADGGTPLGVLVADDFEIGEGGRFTIDLDFGGQFNGGPRWLEIDVNDVTLSPRQPIMAAPHAMVATTAANVPTKAVVGSYAGITGVGTLDSLDVAGSIFSSTSGIPIRGVRDSPTGTFPGVWGETNSASSGTSGVRGYANHTAPGANAAGVWGHSLSETDNGIGVRGTHDADGIGVKGESATGFGGYFIGKGYFSDYVGIGTTEPFRPLHVVGDDGGDAIQSSGTLRVSKGTDESGTGIQIVRSSGSAPFFTSRSTEIDGNELDGYIPSFPFGDASLRLNHHSSGDVLLANGGGNTGIGTTSPNVRLHVIGGSNIDLEGGGFLALGSLNSTNLVLDNNEIMARNSGQTANLHLNKLGGEVHVGFFSNGAGRLVTPVLQITGGSDLSEKFDVAELDDLTPESGMVVCIDPHNPGKLIPSTRAYDRTVAGIISGANGINTGMMMGQEGTEADGAHPVALTGRVYVMVDATTGGAIQPGDLLTTSDTPGHAMKVADYSMAQGAIIGKAMSSLSQGERGLVLVLVSLQ